MITVSDSFKTELENGNRNYLVRVDITLADSTVLPTITKDNLIDLSIEDAVSQDTKFTALGGAVINKAVINIDNSNENYSNYNFNNATVAIQVGLQVNNTPEYVDRGLYIVDSVSPKGVGLELSCLDYMSKFDKSYTNSEIVYPATIQEVIEDACTICGVAFTGTYPDSDYVLTITPSVATFREVLSAVGQITGTFAHIDRQGRLYFSWFDIESLNSAIDSDTKISGVHYIDEIISNNYEKDNITIAGVRCYIINDESNEKFEYHYPATLAENDFCLNLTGNPLIHGGNITEIINRVGARIIGLTIRQTNCKHVNNPTIEAGDVAMVLYSVKNNTNAYYPIVITRTTFTINQAQETVCGVETLSENLDGRYSDAQLLREQTKKDTNDARKVATNYLSADTTGIMIADLADGIQTPSTATGRNVKIDNDSVDIRDGQEVLASFSDITTIGKSNESHQQLDYHSLQLINKEHTAYFYVSDLRNKQGIYTTTENYNSLLYADSGYIKTGMIINTLISVVVNGVERVQEATIDTTFKTRIVLNNLNAEDTATVVYTTIVPQATAFTFGFRNGGSNIGGLSSVHGDYCVASGFASFAEGGNTIASGDSAHAEGVGSIASGYYSHAECQGTTASGHGSHAEGYSTTASGGYSHAEGRNTTASGSNSHSEGWTTTASGQACHAEGDSTIASGSISHAEGYKTTASGYGSHAEGDNTIASGNYSHAEGYKTTASHFDGAHAEGWITTASNDAAHAEGWCTVASGSISHAGGYFTIASSKYQTTIGKYNIADYNNTYAFIIGNGTDENARSNAFTVDWNGNVNIPSGASYKVDGVSLDSRYVNITGDTMTGTLSISTSSGAAAILKNTATAADGSAITSQIPMAYRWTQDKNGYTCFYTETQKQTSGQIYQSFVVRNRISGTDYANGFYLYVSNTGVPAVGFTNNTVRDAWATGLNVVKKAGDTMTGPLTISVARNTSYRIKFTDVDARIGQTAPSSNIYWDKSYVLDKNDRLMHYEEGSWGTNNNFGFTYGLRRYSANGNSSYTNYFNLGIDNSGNGSVSVSHPAAWRTAIGCAPSGYVKPWTLIAETSGTTAKSYSSIAGYTEACVMAWYSTTYLSYCVVPLNSLSLTTEWELYLGGGRNGTGTSQRRAVCKFSGTKITPYAITIDGSTVNGNWRVYVR